MKSSSKGIALVAVAAGVGWGAILYSLTRPSVEAVAATVYMTRECECCGEWVGYMKRNGFLVNVRYASYEELAGLKDRVGVPPSARSCHLAEVKGYAVEGHVPADVVRRLLRERSDVLGAAVPGMPAGSPGMEVPGQPPHPYDVVAIQPDGALTTMERR